MKRKWIVGITGASGAVYGVRLVSFLLHAGFEVHLVVTDSGWRVLREELDWNAAKRQAALDAAFGELAEGLVYYPNADIGAAIASGSFRTEGMVICPCSMGTLAAVSQGMSDNLMERAADVMLKEGKRLILVPRETPLHAIHLENMLRLAKMGVSIIPAMPAFYHRPDNMTQLIDFVVGKVLDRMDVDHRLFRRWGETDETIQTGFNDRPN